MARQQHDSSDDEFEFDEEYFSQTYRPLSNLPTPPLSSRDSSASQSPRILLEDADLFQSELLGPAIHLVNLVPPSASLVTPSVTLVHEILTRAHLTLDTVALAVCILDSLDSKFSIRWRLRCPLETAAHAKRHTLPANPVGSGNQLHIDCVNPEVIVLAALMIAVKFVEDCQEPTQYYRSVWAKKMWTCEQINTTERCVMESLGYRILPLWDAELIADTLDDMVRAGKQAFVRPPQKPSARRGIAGSGSTGDDLHKRSKSAISPGKAVVGLGFQLTPVETPESEKTSPYDMAHSLVPDEVRAAFLGTAASYLSRDCLQLPEQTGKTACVAAAPSEYSDGF